MKDESEWDRKGKGKIDERKRIGKEKSKRKGTTQGIKTEWIINAR